MTYIPQTWNNNDPTTPLSAARLNYIEAGIAGAAGMSSRATVMLGTIGQPTPALADYVAFNAAVAPRKIDVFHIFQNFDSEPLWYGGYEAWAYSLGATIFSSVLSATNTLNSYVSSGNDASGLYSGGIGGLAATAVAWGKPVIVRLFPEFNGNWNQFGYTKETAAQFVAGWKHVVDVFRAAGAYNVAWVWCPNVWGGATMIDPTIPDSSGVNWYPGDDYVDLIGLDGYMMTGNASVETPEQVFLSSYNSLIQAFPNKPFCIPEFGVAKDARLAAAVGGKAGWYDLFFKMIREKMPKTVFVSTWERNHPPDDTTISSSGTDSAAAAEFALGVRSPPFVPSVTSFPNSNRPDIVPAVFFSAGGLVTAVGTGRFPSPATGTIMNVRTAVGTAPTGAAILVDVNKNGTTIFTTQANRPSIAISGTSSSAATPDVTSITSGDLLSADIDQVGSTIPGSDLTVIVSIHPS